MASITNNTNDTTNTTPTTNNNNGKSETPSETFTRLNGGVSAYKTQNGLTFAALCQLVKNGLSVINTSQYYIQYMLVHISLFSCTLLGYIHSM